MYVDMRSSMYDVYSNKDKCILYLQDTSMNVNHVSASHCSELLLAAVESKNHTTP